MSKISFFTNAFFLVAVPFFATVTIAYSQQITEADKEEQEAVLKEDPRNFAANFVVGAYYYNLAVPPHEETTKMSLIQYLDGGEPYENKKEDFLKKSLPYFENAYAIQKEPRLKVVLKNIYQHLGMLPTFRVTEAELSQMLEDKLNQIKFKAIE